MIDFCQLNEAQNGEIIKTTAIYKGVEEYWGLTSNNNCDLDHQVYLNTEENYQNEYNKRLINEFDKLYKNYWKYSLKLKIIGRVEKTTNELGYGHLGLKKIQIVPFQIEIVEKQKLKFDNE